jgi:hypothetical protein
MVARLLGIKASKYDSYYAIVGLVSWEKLAMDIHWYVVTPAFVVTLREYPSAHWKQVTLSTQYKQLDGQA